VVSSFVGDVAARYALACALAAGGEDEPALEAFLEVVARDRTFRDDGARARCSWFSRGSGPITR